MAKIARTAAAALHENRTGLRKLPAGSAQFIDARENVRLINQLHRACQHQIRDGANLFLSAKVKAEEIGERLLIERRKTRHGDWLLWLQANCPALPERTAQWYMKLATRKCLQTQQIRKLAPPPVDLQSLRRLLLIGEVYHPPLPHGNNGSMSLAPAPVDSIQIEMVGLIIRRWINSVYRQRRDAADPDQLRYWLELLQPAADTVAEIKARLGGVMHS